MQILMDCLPCMLRQALEASRMTTDDVEIQEKIMEECIQFVVGYKNFRNAPDAGRAIHNVIKAYTGIEDPYAEIKERDLAAAKSVYPYLKTFLSDYEGSLYWALKIAATGNNIDAAIYNTENFRDTLEIELEKEFAVSDMDVFLEKMKTAKKVLVIGDNTGETIFDKVLMERLSGMDIVYGVRSRPIINDTTDKEARESGINEVAEIISTGCTAPGTILEDCSEEFMEIYRTADIIISKGQGNYETLSDEGENIFFLLKAKCPMISGRLQVALNDYVFKYKGYNQ